MKFLMIFESLKVPPDFFCNHKKFQLLICFIVFQTNVKNFPLFEISKVENTFKKFEVWKNMKKSSIKKLKHLNVLKILKMWTQLKEILHENQPMRCHAFEGLVALLRLLRIGLPSVRGWEFFYPRFPKKKSSRESKIWSFFEIGPNSFQFKSQRRFRKQHGTPFDKFCYDPRFSEQTFL